MAGLLVGCDVGGTFTDAVAVDPAAGSRATAKVSTTPNALEEGVSDAVEAVLDRVEARPGDVERVLHGTTVATNALLEDDLARVALITDEGFRDVLEIGRQTRASLYDLDRTGPAPLVDRELRFEVPGRLDADGHEVEPVDLPRAREVAEKLRDADVDAVSVCRLHAHVEPAHEREIAAVLEETLDGVHVATSAGTSPEVREVERFTTTVANAGLVPAMRAYLERLDEALTHRGVEAPVRVMDSAGGLVAPTEAARLPVRMALSGPAGGVAAVARVAEALGVEDAVGVDMGGTSTDVSLVLDGAPTTRWETTVAGRTLQVPAADVHTVGAGGGSIATADAAGGLRVGPASAGAEPGPACYGRGGQAPTVTDANVLLDRVPADVRLGGRLALDRDAAEAALERLADARGSSTAATAAAIARVTVARGARGIRVLSARHAADPGALTLVAFGGAGPQFGAEWADELGIPRVLVPRAAGVASAGGLLSAPPRVERARSLVRELETLDADALAEGFEALEARAREAFGADVAGVEQRASVRYEGQSHTLTVEVPKATPEAVRAAFEAEHEAQHGYRLPEAGVEVVTLRVRVHGEAAWTPEWEPKPGARETPEASGSVDAWHAGPGQRRSTPVYEREALAAGHRLDGPAVLLGEDTTVLVPPNWEAHVRRVGTVLERGDPS